MNIFIDHQTFLILKSLYDIFIENLYLSKKKLQNKSLLLTIMKLTSNDTYKIISTSSRSFEGVFHSELKTLEENGYIRHPDIKEKLDEMVITVKGIWFIENAEGILELNDILTFIQNSKFEFSSVKQELTDTEKVILLSMLAVRVFSQNIPMDLNETEACNNWQEIIENMTIPELRKMKLIKLESVIEKTGNEHPISYLMRHANNLPKKTNNLFASTKRNQYYLDLNLENRIKYISQITYLLKKIVPNLSSQPLTDEIYNFLCLTANNQSLFVTSSFEFVTPSWDREIKECLDQIYLGLDIRH